MACSADFINVEKRPLTGIPPKRKTELPDPTNLLVQYTSQQHFTLEWSLRCNSRPVQQRHRCQKTRAPFVNNSHRLSAKKVVVESHKHATLSNEVAEMIAEPEKQCLVLSNRSEEIPLFPGFLQLNAPHPQMVVAHFQTNFFGCIHPRYRPLRPAKWILM